MQKFKNTLKKFKRKLKKIKYFEEKKRFIIYSLFLLSLLFLSFYLIKKAYGTYETDVTLNAHIDRAFYVLNDEKLSFNLDSNKVIPQDEPFVYKFSISNFNTEKESDVDLQYTIDLISTTNLPLTIEMYRNEVYGTNNITNILESPILKQDPDGAWYRTYTPSKNYTMLFDEHVTDVYTLVIFFPKIYSKDTTYADAIENIQITIDSKQLLK